MKNLQDYTTDELISELRKREGGFFVTIIPVDWAVEKIGEYNTQKYLGNIQELFMESEDVDDAFHNIMDTVMSEIENHEEEN